YHITERLSTIKRRFLTRQRPNRLCPVGGDGATTTNGRPWTCWGLSTEARADIRWNPALVVGRHRIRRGTRAPFSLVPCSAATTILWFSCHLLLLVLACDLCRPGGTRRRGSGRRRAVPSSPASPTTARSLAPRSAPTGHGR